MKAVATENASNVGRRSRDYGDDAAVNDDALTAGEYAAHISRTAPGTTIAWQHACTYAPSESQMRAHVRQKEQAATIMFTRRACVEIV